MDGAMSYYQQFNAMTESSYPYISGTSTSRKTCSYSEAEATSVMDLQVTDVKSDSMDQLMAAVA